MFSEMLTQLAAMRDDLSTTIDTIYETRDGEGREFLGPKEQHSLTKQARDLENVVGALLVASMRLREYKKGRVE